MKKYQNDSSSLRNFRNLCEDTIEKVYEVYGVNAFRRINRDGSVTPINRAIMDALMISAISYPKDRLLSRKGEIQNRLRSELNNDSEFRLSTLTSTSDAKVLNFRISFWCKAIDELLR